MTKGSALWVGWREMAALPGWGIPRILAKVDTGARTSALHVEDMETQDDGLLRFMVVVRERPERQLVEVVTRPVRWSRVRPSSGETQLRPVVRTTLGLGSWAREVEISLVQRRGMLCRMLIGRTSMHGLVVDPTRRYLASRPPTSKSSKPSKSSKSSKSGGAAKKTHPKKSRSEESVERASTARKPAVRPPDPGEGDPESKARRPPETTRKPRRRPT